MSLDCEAIEVTEDVGEQEICARLNGGDLAVNITVNFITSCDEPCGKSYIYSCSDQGCEF